MKKSEILQGKIGDAARSENGVCPLFLESGFTLIEILIALAILAVAVAGLVKASGDNVDQAAYLENKVFAHWVAMNELTELQLVKPWPSVSNKDKTIEMANREWWVRSKISDTEDKQLRRADISVGLKAQDEVRSNEENPIISLTGFVGEL